MAGNSMLEPASLCTSKVKSCAREVEKTRGAPSTGRTNEGLCRQETWLGSTARRGGNCAASTAGSPTTSTDLGLWNEGGLLSLRFNWSPFGTARAGMYWYVAV